MAIVAHGGPVVPPHQDTPWAITETETQTDGLGAGAYVARLGRPYVDRERQYVAAPFDVACGPQRGDYDTD